MVSSILITYHMVGAEETGNMSRRSGVLPIGAIRRWSKPQAGGLPRPEAHNGPFAHNHLARCRAELLNWVVRLGFMPPARQVSEGKSERARFKDDPAGWAAYASPGR